MSSGIVKYASFSMEEVNEAEKAVNSLSSGKYLEKLPEGDTVLRFLPARPGERVVRITAMHYCRDVPGLDKLFAFSCPRYELKQECFVCAKCEELSRSPLKDDKDKAKSWSPRVKVYANVIDRGNPELGVRVWGFGKSIWEQLKELRKNMRTGGDYTDPTERGFDVVVTRTGTGQNDTEYKIMADRQCSPLCEGGEPAWDAIIASQHNLEAEIDATPAEELLAALGSGYRQPARQAAPAPAQMSAGPAAGSGLMDRMRGGAGGVSPKAAPAPIQATPPQRNAVEAAMADDDDFEN